MMKGAHSIEAKKESDVNMKCFCHCETPPCGVEAIRSLRLLRRPFGPPRKDGINKNEQGISWETHLLAERGSALGRGRDPAELLARLVRELRELTLSLELWMQLLGGALHHLAQLA